MSKVKTAAHKKRISITVLFISILIVLVVGFAGCTFYNRNPLSKEWDYKGRFTVFDSHSLTLTSYPSDNSSIISITIPPDVYINVSGGYGYYRVKDVLELSRSERRGDELLIERGLSLIRISFLTSQPPIFFFYFFFFFFFFFFFSRVFRLLSEFLLKLPSSVCLIGIRFLCGSLPIIMK